MIIEMLNSQEANQGGVDFMDQLPDTVSAEPRNEEEAHLQTFNSIDAVKTYLAVSDDQGELLRDTDLEQQVREFCNKCKDQKKEITDLPEILENAKQLATRYTLQINKVESGLAGIIAKYRIRQGMIFNIMKSIVKKTKGPKWIEWFQENFDGREFRSIQDYMRLAKIPGIIRYAVFGKERLLQIYRQLSDDDKKTADPVGTFIERAGINFDPTEEMDVQELKIEADIAINCQKLLRAGITGVPEEKVGILVRNGREIESSHVKELKVAIDAGYDVAARFDEILASNGRPEPLMTPTRKAEGFKKTTDRFLKAMDSAIGDAEYRVQVNVDLITSLKEKIQQLEQLILSSN